MNVERLQKLADFLKRPIPGRFNMREWIKEDIDDEGNVCGTAACALGWACTIPEFRAAGLTLSEPAIRTGFRRYSPRCEGERSYTAGAKFFGLGLEQAMYLFDFDRYPDPHHITRCEVVERIEEMIADERAKTAEAR
jgi:hypothetical protein